MNHPAPVLWLLARSTRTNRTLRQELSGQRIRNLSLEHRLAVAMRERDQARRYCELMALCAKDRAGALAFLRDAHRIDRGEVA